MSLKDHYRNLTTPEVDTLKLNGCSSGEWERIRVKNGFDPSRCVNVIFSEDILLGVFNQPFIDESGLSFNSGIFNARLHNCEIGSDVVINNIGDYIANYTIEDKVVIRNCGRIHTKGLSSFGNGTSVAVLSETGARAVKIWDRLSSHEAYIVALYRHKTRVVSILEKLVDDYSASAASDKGTIGHHSRILNCKTIQNVKAGPFSHIEGTLLLENGSVNSCEADPVHVGYGVIMRNFIVCSGSRVADSTVVDKCFIGQGCILAKQFSADNSLFFANSEGLLGEASSIFAGPYTVTHHKSTLLLAGYFSFMNAGSGSNQSNHMYKLGPVHAGIMERGSKTTSNSYLIWPSHIGAFSLVKGSHFRNIDASSLPFSYIIEGEGESILVPGINLKSIGSYRDSNKWPLRDRRKDSKKIDQLIFNMLSPYTIRKMINGKEVLRRLRTDSTSWVSLYSYNNMQIKGSALERGIELYQSAVNEFIGRLLIDRLGKSEFKTIEEIRKRLHSGESNGRGEWVDLSGLIVPKQEVEKLLDKIESGKVTSAETLNELFAGMHSSYKTWEWESACEVIEAEAGTTVNKLTVKDLISIIEKWKKSMADLNKRLYEDAGKEFSELSMIGFGLDGSDDAKKLDFEKVRGNPESNDLVMAVQVDSKESLAEADELLDRLNKLA